MVSSSLVRGLSHLGLLRSHGCSGHRDDVSVAQETIEYLIRDCRIPERLVYATPHVEGTSDLLRFRISTLKT